MSTFNNNNYIKLIDYIKNNQNDFYRLAFSYVKNKEEALDVVQESIYKILISFKTLKNPEYMKTWIYRIIVNTSISYIRKNRRTYTVEDIPEIMKENEIDIAGNLDLYSAIDKLNEKHKSVVILRYFEDMKIEEISKVIGCNTNTVKTRIYTAVKKLKAIIEGGM